MIKFLGISSSVGYPLRNQVKDFKLHPLILQRLGDYAEKIVRKYYSSIDRRDLRAAVDNFFAQDAIYVRNGRTFIGLNDEEASSISSFYKQGGRKINGKHTVTKAYSPSLSDFMTLYNKAKRYSISYTLEKHLRPNVIPVCVEGAFAGQFSDNDESKEISLKFQDFFLIDPSQGGKVCFRQSIVTDPSGKLLKV